MTAEDAVRIVGEAVVTHFGMGMIFAGLGCEVERVGRESGVRTVAAKDGMHIRVGEEITGA